MTATPVMAATRWKTNGYLLADCRRLGYLKDSDFTLDPTYGRGRWWTVWRPEVLVAHDIREDGVDFTELPYLDGTFDAVTFDPPYVSVGGRRTTGLSDFHDRYGLEDAPKSPADLQHLIDRGLGEMFRVVKPGGIVLVKCQDYVSSGRLWLGTHWTLTTAMDLGFVIVDRLEHIGAPRPQPPGRRQVHARRNLSTLFVLRRPK